MDLPMTRRAAALLAVEGLALGVVGLVDGLRADAQDRSAAVATTLFAVLGGLLLAGLARAVSHRHAWARTPSVVLQLLALPVGTDLLRGHVWAAGIPVLLLAGATLFHLATLERE
ncbi:MAG: hypothetical protein LC789_13875 [Actinobacteria bacterium]|nr:hypothetical protein [Actinomycetota bacterium]MCA1721487.1 hypothetical protein [Actinomycetota bacterium]